MIESKCFNLSKGGRSCKVLTVTPCPKDCSSKVTDPQKYIETLEALMYYNWETNKQMVADLRKEVMAIREKYDIVETEFERNLRDGPFADWKEVYYSEVRRKSAKGGGASEKNTNPSKPRENDNRVLETKWTKAEREELKEETEKWEKEHGKLPKLGFSPLSRNKVDSYTGEPIK